MLTAVVSGTAVVAGFPALPGWVRTSLAGLTALIAGVVAALQNWRHDDTSEGPSLVARQAERVATPHLLPKPELFQLPPDPAHFTNQEHAVRSITAAATTQRGAGSGPAVVVISGRAGVGKTALAVRVAHQLRAHFAAGQLYVNLHGVEERPVEAGEVLEEFLRDLGVAPSAMPLRLEDRARVYRSKLAEGRFLVLLDNAADELQVRPLIPWGPGCTVLVTSRGRLPGLDGAQLIPLEVLDEPAALRLLTSFVGQARVDAEPDAARSIVRLCGRLPLAIKVAGAKLAARPHWRVSRLLERLQDEQARLGELQVGDVGVRSVLALSYTTRNDRERRAFRRLGLLSVSSLPAWAVAALIEDGLRETEDLLESLAQAHLVDVAGEDVAGQMHYRLHDLLRDFAREQVFAEEAKADRDGAIHRYLAAYAAVATQARQRLEPGSVRAGDAGASAWRLADTTPSKVLPDDPVQWFEFERSNLAGVVQQAFEVGFAPLGWLLLECLSPFFEHQASWARWRQAAQRAQDAAVASGNRQAQAAAAYELGWVARFEGRFAQSVERLGESLSVFEELDDRPGRAKALSGLGVALHDTGRWREAIDAFEQSLALLAQLDDRGGRARTMHELAVVYRLQGHFARAIELLEASRDLFGQLGDRHWTARSDRGLADVYAEQGRLQEALDLLELARQVFGELGDRRWEATTGMRIGEVYVRQGRLQEALAVFDEVRPVLHELGDRRWEAMTILRAGQAKARQGRLEEALSDFDQALAVFRETGDQRFAAITLVNLGEVRARHGRLEEALAAVDEALPILQELGDRQRMAEALRARGGMRAVSGDRAVATEDLRAALRLYVALERHDDAQELQAELARLDREHG